MIRRLRARHRRFWTMAAFALPVLYLLTLLLRPGPDLEERLPTVLQGDTTQRLGGSF